MTESHPKVTNEESFREALTRLLAEAETNEVAISGRSWECTPDGIDRNWDVEIVVLQNERDSEKRLY